MAEPKNIAIVCDWLYGGGAEKVVLELHRMFPDAPIYTSYCSDEWRKRLDNTVVTGYLQRWFFAKTRKFLPLLRQWWFANLDLTGYDLVISCTGNGEAKFARAQPGAYHLCYCFTPNHFYWDKYQEYLDNPGMGKLNGLARLGLKLLVKPLRQRDFRAAQNVDQLIAISQHIQEDIKTYYRRDSGIIHPPVATSHLAPASPKTTAQTKRRGYVVWGRHVPYKRLDIAIAACNALNVPLAVIGNGPDTPRLKAMAGPTITFPGFVSDEQLRDYAAAAEAFIFPSKEDFGIAPVEAMALGLPVIAYRAGGALDYVTPGKTGEFFDEQTVQSATKALEAFSPQVFSASTIIEHADRYSQQVFQEKIRKQIGKLAL